MVALVIFSVWSWMTMRTITQVVDNQGDQILIQAAEWQVILSTLPEAEKTNFINAVNEVLKQAQAQQK